jgi:hypothetical protein
MQLSRRKENDGRKGMLGIGLTQQSLEVKKRGFMCFAGIELI